jgi:hypothetical protein
MMADDVVFAGIVVVVVVSVAESAWRVARRRIRRRGWGTQLSWRQTRRVVLPRLPSVNSDEQPKRFRDDGVKILYFPAFNAERRPGGRR